MKKINRTQALELMKGNKGHFFTVRFFKKNNEKRTLNGKYVSHDNLGYVKVSEMSKKKKGERDVRNVNLQTIFALKAGGIEYKIQ